MAAGRWMGMAFSLLMVCSSGASGSQAVAGSSVTRVNTGDSQLSRLVEVGAVRSATFAELLRHFESTGWLVFIDWGHCPSKHSVGCLLHSVERRGDERYLRIVVDRWQLRNPDLELSTIAHELQHALETATASEVTDGASMSRLFAGIGYVDLTSGRSATFETDAAKRMGVRVLEELQRARIPNSKF